MSRTFPAVLWPRKPKFVSLKMSISMIAGCYDGRRARRRVEPPQSHPGGGAAIAKVSFLRLRARAALRRHGARRFVDVAQFVRKRLGLPVADVEDLFCRRFAPAEKVLDVGNGQAEPLADKLSHIDEAPSAMPTQG